MPTIAEDGQEGRFLYLLLTLLCYLAYGPEARPVPLQAPGLALAGLKAENQLRLENVGAAHIF
jgi:hypothetical protein